MKAQHPTRWTVVGLFWLAILAILLGIPYGAEPSTLADAAVVAVAGADLYSTHVAMQRGGQEINTVSSLRGQAAIHAGVAGASILLAHQAEREGRRGWARAIRLVPIVVFGGAAVWNMTRGGR